MKAAAEELRSAFSICTMHCCGLGALLSRRASAALTALTAPCSTHPSLSSPSSSAGSQASVQHKSPRRIQRPCKCGQRASSPA